MKYSPSTGCFYPEDIEYPELPEDLVDASDADYAMCMARSFDEVIVYADGRFAITKQSGPTDEELKQIVKEQAKALLAATDYTQIADVAALITNAEEFTSYRAMVRAIFKAPMVDPTWPVLPDPNWI